MKKLFFLSLFILAISCNTNPKPAINFYFWKTNFKLSTTEKKALQQTNSQKLYIRYFDIDLLPNKNPYPKAPILFSQRTTNQNVVPVIYIRNKVFVNSQFTTASLAKQVIGLINQINQSNGIKNSNEIQLDCDWTLQTKTNYFNFINEIKKQSNKKIAATIRLHQIKYYKKTGVPKVDSAVLMYYNMGTIATNSSNSIYQKSIANRYLKFIKNYPLPLKVALPIFSWAIQIRNNKIIRLNSKISCKSLDKDTNFTKTKNSFYTVKKSHYKNGVFYKNGDQLKIEAILQTDLQEMVIDLQANLAQKPTEIIFYDLDAFNINQYENNIFTKISNSF